MAIASSLLALSENLISTTHCVCNATVLCSEGPCVVRWPLQVRQSLEPKQRMLCLVHVSPCRSLCHLRCAPAAGSLVEAQGRGQEALDRLVVAISPTGLYLEGEEEEEEGTSGKGGRVGWG